jgi:hypothetical protein
MLGECGEYKIFAPLFIFSIRRVLFLVHIPERKAGITHSEVMYSGHSMSTERMKKPDHLRFYSYLVDLKYHGR